MKTISFKKIGILACVSVSLVLAGYFSVKYLLAVNNPWTQTDWSGGVSSNVATGSINTFLNSTDLVTSNPGYLTIPQVQNWDNNMAGWTERVKITFDNTLITLGTAPERLTDFPLLVKLQNGKNVDYTKTQNSGQDIRFVDQDGTILSHEIELWDEAGDSFVWVKIPAIEIGNTDYVWLYYGNSAASDAQDPTNIWTNNYVMLQHLNELSGTVYDKTSYHNDGTSYGSTSITGKIGKARSFNGSSDYIATGTVSRPTNTFTVEAWVNTSSTHEIDGETTNATTGVQNQRYLAFPDNMGGDSGMGISVGTNGISVYEHAPGYMPPLAVYSGTLPSGWNHISVVYNAKTPKIYLNGTLVRTGLTSPRGNVYAPASIGGGAYGYFQGGVDEFAISKVARSSAWIAAQSKNLSNYSAPQSKYLLGWQYKRQITFNNTQAVLGMTPEELTNFPVAIKLTNGVNVDYTKTQNSGQDIRFVDQDGTVLSHEIEIWDENGESVVWVKVPKIDVGSTDFIWMYYGNGSAADAQNPDDVWTNGYVIVQNMEEGSGTVYDSTENNYDGTATGTTSATGKVGKGRSFNGSGDYISLSPLPLYTESTQSAWVQTNNIGLTRQYIYTNQVNPPVNGYYTYQERQGIFLSGGQPQAQYWKGNGEISMASVTSVTNGTWNYITWTVDSSGGKLYLNGNLVDSNATIASTSITPTQAFIGRRGDANGEDKFSGVIDNLRVSNVSRTQAWIKSSFSTDSGTFQSYGSETTTNTLTSNIFNTSYPTDWQNLTFTTAGTGNVIVKARSSNNSDMSAAPEWSTCNTIANDTQLLTTNCVTLGHQYIQYQVQLVGSSLTDIIRLNDITINYAPNDKEKPTANASNVGITSEVGINNWVKTPPAISWNSGTDAFSGILGYCVALEELDVDGVSSSLDPETQGGLFTGLDDGVTVEFCPYIVTTNNIDLNALEGLQLENNKQYYFSIKAVDNSGNVWAGDSADYQNLATFKYDDILPKNVSYITTPSGSFGNIDDMFFTWPESGNASSTDSVSGVLGWQYSINDTNSWTGTTHENTLNIDYIPLTDAQYTFSLNGSVDGPKVIIGNNLIHFRTVDIAGNFSPYVAGAIAYGGQAPTFDMGTKVTITPETNTENKFGISWPEAKPTEGRTIDRYYYMINTTPPNSYESLTSNSGLYIPITETSIASNMLIGAIKGSNVVYVVAVDDQNGYAASNAISGTFNLNSTLPDPARNVTAIDSSIKSAELWRASVTWDRPTYEGDGNLSYIVQRSDNNETWQTIANTTGLAYTDTVPQSKTYFYRVGVSDGSDISRANPTFSQSSSVKPQGRFTVAANLVSTVSITGVTTRQATISWVTDRESDSKIEYGLNSETYFEGAISYQAQTTEHSVKINNLEPNTLYFFRAVWTDEDGNTGQSHEITFRTDPAPLIKDVQISKLGLNYALVEFWIEGASKAKIVYGKTDSYGGLESINTSPVNSKYSIMLSNLEDGTLYHYRIDSEDNEGFTYKSYEDHTFTTPPRPKISSVTVEEIKGVASPTVKFSWESNTEISSIVNYYPSGNQSTSLDKVDIKPIKGTHSMEVSGLSPETKYYATVEGVDSMGNRAVSDILQFTTATDTRPPRIYDLKVEKSVLSSDIQADRERSAQLIVSWKTDEPATSQVSYGIGLGTEYTQMTKMENNYKTEHVVIITNLTPSTVYHIQASSQDIANNLGKSSNMVSVTPKATNTAFETVVDSLGKVFYFLK